MDNAMVAVLLSIWTLVGALAIALLILAITNRWPKWPKVIRTETVVVDIQAVDGSAKPKEPKKVKVEPPKPVPVKIPTTFRFTCEKCSAERDLDIESKSFKCDCGAEYEFTKG